MYAPLAPPGNRFGRGENSRPRLCPPAQESRGLGQSHDLGNRRSTPSREDLADYQKYKATMVPAFRFNLNQGAAGAGGEANDDDLARGMVDGTIDVTKLAKPLDEYDFKVESFVPVLIAQ